MLTSNGSEVAIERAENTLETNDNILDLRFNPPVNQRQLFNQAVLLPPDMSEKSI